MSCSWNGFQTVTSPDWKIRYSCAKTGRIFLHRSRPPTVASGTFAFRRE